MRMLNVITRPIINGIEAMVLHLSTPLSSYKGGVVYKECNYEDPTAPYRYFAPQFGIDWLRWEHCKSRKTYTDPSFHKPLVVIYIT